MDLRRTIVIYADYGFGAYAWIGTGGNIADSIGWTFERPISARLHAAFGAWALEFERAPTPWRDEAAYHAYDWSAFNRRGITLTRRLKRELGPDIHVFYQAPQEDPYHQGVGSIEVRDDGSLVRSAR
jgi:hypothetical protein